MEVMFKSCAGLDVHKRIIVACALVSSAEGVQRHLKTWQTTLAGLEALAAWLTGLGVDSCGDGKQRGVLEAGFNVLTLLFEVWVVMRAISNRFLGARPISRMPSGSRDSCARAC